MFCRILKLLPQVSLTMSTEPREETRQASERDQAAFDRLHPGSVQPCSLTGEGGSAHRHSDPREKRTARRNIESAMLLDPLD